jgi:hypothetical protein
MSEIAWLKSKLSHSLLPTTPKQSRTVPYPLLHVVRSVRHRVDKWWMGHSKPLVPIQRPWKVRPIIEIMLIDALAKCHLKNRLLTALSSAETCAWKPSSGHGSGGDEARHTNIWSVVLFALPFLELPSLEDNPIIKRHTKAQEQVKSSISTPRGS